MSPKSQPAGHTVPSGIKNRTLVTSGKWLQRMGHLRQTASSWPPHTRSLRQTVAWDKWPPHVGSLRQLSASGKWPPHMGLCKQMAAPGEQQPCVGRRGKRPLQTNGSCMHSWCAPCRAERCRTHCNQPAQKRAAFLPHPQSSTPSPVLAQLSPGSCGWPPLPHRRATMVTRQLWARSPADVLSTSD